MRTRSASRKKSGHEVRFFYFANAAKALGRAISVGGKGDAELDAAYGEALVMANNGAVPPEAGPLSRALHPPAAPSRVMLLDRRRRRRNRSSRSREPHSTGPYSTGP